MNDKNSTLVSIIIPNYNHGCYLDRALNSVLNQTYQNWEMIVIDNNSTDNTNEVMANFADPRITYLKLNNDGIIAISRNAGIRIAKGEWIAFLDSDDWWVENKLKECLDYINHEVDLIYHDLQIVYRQAKIFKRKIIKSKRLKKPILVDLLVEGNTICNSSVMVRKSYLEKIGYINEDRELVAAEDYNTWLRIAQLTDQFVYVPRMLGYYLMHNQNISKKNMLAPTRRAIDEFLYTLNTQQKNNIEALFKYSSGRLNYLNRNNKKAKSDLFFALKYCKIIIKLKILWMLGVLVVRRIFC